MKTEISQNGLSWINFKNPSRRDLAFLKKNFSFDENILHELTIQSQRPRAEESANYFYAVIHVPLFDKKKQTSLPGEVNIVLTENCLITSHQGENLPIKAILREFKKNPALLNQAFSRSTGFLLYFIWEKLLLSCFDKIDHINEKIDRLEKDIFEESKKAMIREISQVKRDILAFRRILKPQRNTLESIVKGEYRLIEQNSLRNYHALVGINIRVWNSLENTKEVIESLEETNNLLVSFNLNQTIRFLSAISLITFFLSATTGIFSMLPFATLSVSGRPLFFWLVIVFMAVITGILTLIFRKKNWL